MSGNQLAQNGSPPPGRHVVQAARQGLARGRDRVNEGADPPWIGGRRVSKPVDVNQRSETPRTAPPPEGAALFKGMIQRGDRSELLHYFKA
ncbi:MAG TPA: hypothetical protein VNX28_02860 [Gemmataceae bacterium]|jgi:hypothetical protein|nr:hypothetical protein [Gemmataceae bacterium]